MVCEQSSKRSSGAIINKKMKLENELDRAIEQVDSEIQLHKEGKGTAGTMGQLVNIQDELKQMKSVLDSSVLKPYYPKVIVDSWEFDSKLGLLLMRVAEDYEKLT